MRYFMDKYGIAILLGLWVVACTPEVEEMIMFTDSHRSVLFEEKLIESKIPYTKQNSQFHYLIKNRDQIKEIVDEVHEILRPTNLFFFTGGNMFEDVKLTFENAKIEYKVLRKEDGIGLKWQDDDNVLARKIIRKVTGLPI